MNRKPVISGWTEELCEAWIVFKREKWNALGGLILFLVMMLIVRAL